MMEKKVLYLVPLACYVAAVFLVTSEHFLAGILCMGIGTCFIGLAGKRRGSSGQENKAEGQRDESK